MHIIKKTGKQKGTPCANALHRHAFRSVAANATSITRTQNTRHRGLKSESKKHYKNAIIKKHSLCGCVLCALQGSVAVSCARGAFGYDFVVRAATALPLCGTVDCQVSTMPALGLASGFSLFHIDVQNPSCDAPAVGVPSVFSDKCTDDIVYCTIRSALLILSRRRP